MGLASVFAWRVGLIFAVAGGACGSMAVVTPTPRVDLKGLVLHLVISKTKGQTFGSETKMFWYRSQISLVENRLFQFCPESALLGKIERISFDKTNLGKNSIVFSLFVSFLIISERLWNICGTFAPLPSWHYYLHHCSMVMAPLSILTTRCCTCHCKQPLAVLTRKKSE